MSKFIEYLTESVKTYKFKINENPIIFVIPSMRNKTYRRLINWTIRVGSIIALVLILNSDLFIHKKSDVVEGQIK
jgi:hypothetical protein